VTVLGLVLVILVIGLGAAILVIGKSAEGRPGTVNALAESKDACVVCHRRTTPGIVEQYGRSTMAAAGISCGGCHVVESGYPGSISHEGETILPSPTPKMCQTCHTVEVAQYYQSRHSAPAYAAMSGTEGFSEAQIDMYRAIPEGSYDPDKTRNALYGIEGPEITTLACHRCHDIGKPREDGSIGECQKCHIRHEFSLEQARKPETCNACHIGPDHPQWEIYEESPHGIAYLTMGHTYNWDADPGTLTVIDFPAPNCATCHMSGFGATGTTHDVGDRLSWYLFAPKSDRRPAWEGNRNRMQNVCRECHNQEFITNFYSNADTLVLTVNSWVQESDNIANALKAAGAMTQKPFDEPIDFTYFDLWHHWGRTAKFGAWMQGPDYTQWHGAYEMLQELAKMREYAREKLGADLYPLTSDPITGPTTVAAPEGVH
jgi:hypothetical protein